MVGEDDLSRVPESELDTEANLERRLVRTDGAKIGDVEVMYTGRQGSPGDGGIFDLVGVDERGDTVVVELKRGRAPRDIVAQALEYAAELRNVDYDYLNDQYSEFVREEQGDRDEVLGLREAHAQFFGLDDTLSAREFNDTQRLVLVGTEFRDSSLNMADMLREHGIDVVAVEYSTYMDEKNDVELLTTDGIRRPLSEEPTTTSSSSSADYSNLIGTVRDRVHAQVGDMMQLESTDDMMSGEKGLRFSSQDPASLEPAKYRFRPEIEEERSGNIDLIIWGGSDEGKRQVRSIVAEHDSTPNGFDHVDGDSHVLVRKQMDIGYDETEDTIDEIVDSLVELVQFYHPKLISDENATE